jgi:hypothetical protein
MPLPLLHLWVLFGKPSLLVLHPCFAAKPLAVTNLLNSTETLSTTTIITMQEFSAEFIVHNGNGKLPDPFRAISGDCSKNFRLFPEALVANQDLSGLEQRPSLGREVKSYGTRYGDAQHCYIFSKRTHASQLDSHPIFPSHAATIAILCPDFAASY